MDCHVFSTPLPLATPGVHLDTASFLGSERSNLNAAYGYIEHRKPRWTQRVREYQDIGAIEKFGIDPTKPTPLGVTVMADPYGFPIDGYTTGYTMKLPPPADMEVAKRTPRSFNSLSVIAQSDGSETSFVPPGLNMDNPDATWNYGNKTLGMDSLQAYTRAAQQIRQIARNAGVDPATVANILRNQQPRQNTLDSVEVIAPGDSVSQQGGSPAAASPNIPGGVPDDQWNGGVIHTAQPATEDLGRGVIRKMLATVAGSRPAPIVVVQPGRS